MASRRRASRSLSRLGLGPGRIASPSACTSASMSASIRASESVRWAARSLVCSSRSAAARTSKPVRSRVWAADPSSASSPAERGARRRSASERSRQWRLLSPTSAISSGPKVHSTASRMRSAVRRPTANSAWISSSVTPPRRPCMRIASFTMSFRRSYRTALLSGCPAGSARPSLAVDGDARNPRGIAAPTP